MSLNSLSTQNPLSGGEEISLGDLTVPPSMTKNLKHRSENLKKLPYPTQQPTGGNLDKKNSKFCLND